jgi:RHS repeat-associated protein
VCRDRRRRDVVALHYNFGSGAMGHARVRYSAYGVPEPVLTGDLNHEGLLNNDDRVELALIRASEPSGVVTMPGPDWTPDADLNFDGAIDEADASMLTNLVNAGAAPSEPGALWGQGGTSAWRGVAIGYAGMLYDRQAGAFLMRNRWHSPTLGRFLSRDPAGYVDGMSLYAYVSGNPLKYWDPFGLAKQCKIQWHHMLPQGLRERFMDYGADIDEARWGRLMPVGAHQVITSEAWNLEWEAFLDDADLGEIKVTPETVNNYISELSGQKRFRGALAEGATAPVSHQEWLKRTHREREAMFTASRKADAQAIAKVMGKAQAVPASVLRKVAKAAPVLAAVFFITDVANGEPISKAAANAVIIIDVDTVSALGESGQEIISNYIDREHDGIIREKMLKTPSLAQEYKMISRNRERD